MNQLFTYINLRVIGQLFTLDYRSILTFVTKIARVLFVKIDQRHMNIQ